MYLAMDIDAQPVGELAFSFSSSFSFPFAFPFSFPFYFAFAFAFASGVWSMEYGVEKDLVFCYLLWKIAHT